MPHDCGKRREREGWSCTFINLHSGLQISEHLEHCGMDKCFAEGS